MIDQTNATVTAVDASGVPLSPEAEASIQPIPYDGLYSRQVRDFLIYFVLMLSKFLLWQILLSLLLRHDHVTDKQ